MPAGFPCPAALHLEGLLGRLTVMRPIALAFRSPKGLQQASQAWRPGTCAGAAAVGQLNHLPLLYPFAANDVCEAAGGL